MIARDLNQHCILKNCDLECLQSLQGVVPEEEGKGCVYDAEPRDIARAMIAEDLKAALQNH